MTAMLLIIISAVSLTYLVFAFWLRSDLMKIRKMGVHTAPNLTSLVFLVAYPFLLNILGDLVGRPVYRLLNLDFDGYGYYGSFYYGLHQISGMLTCLVVAALIYYFYRLSLVKKINTNNPPLAPLTRKNGILFWIAVPIFIVYIFISFLSRIF